MTFISHETYSPDDSTEQPSLPPPSSSKMIPNDLLELEEVDMESETMDPLEWTIRKLISIPKQYYWDNPTVDKSQLPLKLKIWHRSVGSMGAVVHFIDRLGKPIVNFLGLNSSRFYYVTSTMTDRDWELSGRIVQERHQEHQQEAVEQGKGI